MITESSNTVPKEDCKPVLKQPGTPPQEKEILSQSAFDFVKSARRVITIEQSSLGHLRDSLDDSFNKACQTILACTGRLIIIGMGKSGHIGRKMAATFASTGTPSFFVHPAEASHGDMGMITSIDTVLALSNSGNTEEVIALLPLIKRLNIQLISITGAKGTTLARASDVSLSVQIKEEACPLGLAPTASTTATLALGDALAIALLEARGFTAEDFAFSHPGGSLGKKLLLTVKDLMHSHDRLPKVSNGVSIKEALLEMTAKGLGMTSIVDETGKLVGLYTDGDLRRTLNKDIDVSSTNISQEMTRTCHTIMEHALAAEALQQMEARKINGLIVIDQQQHPIGALNMQDLIKAKVV